MKKVYWIEIRSGYYKYDKEGKEIGENILEKSWIKTHTKEWTVYFYNKIYNMLKDFNAKYYKTNGFKTFGGGE